MSIHKTLLSKVPTKWSVAILTVALIGAIGASALIYAQKADTEQDLNIVRPTQSTLSKIESILRDDSKDAKKRIDEALKVLAGTKTENAQDEQIKWAEPWDPWASPFQRRNWSPFREMQAMRRNMDRLFGDVLRNMDDQPSLLGSEPFRWSPQGEFEENDDTYVYRFDLPGVDKSKIDITVEEGRLTLEGRRESRVEEKNEDEGLFRREISHGQFRRSIALPNDVDVNGAVRSKLDNGVLTVTLPKIKDARKSGPKKIEIQ